MTDGEISPAELSRRMGDVLRQFENLVKQVEDRYVRRDVIELYQKGVDLELASIKSSLDSKADKVLLPDMTKYVSKDKFDGLAQDVSELQSANTWLIRLVMGIIIAGVLAAVIQYGGAR